MSTEWKMHISSTLGLLGTLTGSFVGVLIGMVWCAAGVYYAWKMIKENSNGRPE